MFVVRRLILLVLLVPATALGDVGHGHPGSPGSGGSMGHGGSMGRGGFGSNFGRGPPAGFGHGAAHGPGSGGLSSPDRGHFRHDHGAFAGGGFGGFYGGYAYPSYGTWPGWNNLEIDPDGYSWDTPVDQEPDWSYDDWAPGEGPTEEPMQPAAPPPPPREMTDSDLPTP